MTKHFNPFTTFQIKFVQQYKIKDMLNNIPSIFPTSYDCGVLLLHEFNKYYAAKE